jgi:type VI secretion system protein ImpL
MPQWLFLSHFFHDVLLADRAALGASRASTKTGALQKVLLLSGVALAALFAIFFTISYSRNSSLQAEAREAARALPAGGVTAAGEASLDSLQRLDTLRQSLETLIAYRRDGAPLSLRWGLYTGEDIYPSVRRIYFDRFSRLLFAQTQAGLLDTLRSLPAVGAGPEYGPTYNALKAYLITTSNPDKSTREFLAPVLLARWTSGRAIDGPRSELARKQFEFYSDELRAANPYSNQNDAVGVECGRAYLRQFAGAERVYRFMLEEAAKASPPVSFSKQFPGAADVVTNKYEVAGAFSKNGFAFMQKAFRNADRYFSGEPWVLGDGGSAGVADRAKLEADLRDRYGKDFAAEWRAYVKSSTVNRYANLKDAAAKLEKLSGIQSPLLMLFSLASQHTAVETAEVAQIFQPVQTVVPPGSTDRYIGPTNQGYITALMNLQMSLNQLASQPAMNDADVAQALNHANAARIATKQVAQGFRIDQDGHIEGAVQKLMEDPITYAEGLLRTLGPAELNGKGAALCAQLRPLSRKYPFNPTATEQAAVSEVNAIFRRPDGALWAFYDSSLQKLLTRQGTRYVPASVPGINLTPGFVAFFNNAAAFTDALYPANAAEPKLPYTLRPLASEGIQSMSLRLDGQVITYSGGNAQPRQFSWPGPSREARATVKFGSTDLEWSNYDGPWAVFQFFGDAERWQRGAGTGHSLEWMIRAGRKPMTLPNGNPLMVRFELDMGALPPVFQKGYFASLACVAEVAR